MVGNKPIKKAVKKDIALLNLKSAIRELKERIFLIEERLIANDTLRRSDVEKWSR